MYKSKNNILCHQQVFFSPQGSPIYVYGIKANFQIFLLIKTKAYKYWQIWHTTCCKKVAAFPTLLYFVLSQKMIIIYYHCAIKHSYQQLFDIVKTVAKNVLHPCKNIEGNKTNSAMYLKTNYNICFQLFQSFVFHHQNKKYFPTFFQKF